MNTKQSIIAAIAVVILTVVAPFAGRHGMEIDQATATEWATTLVGLATVIWTIWKNFNFTKAAQIGQKRTNEIKELGLEADELDGFLDENYDDPDDDEEIEDEDGDENAEG